MTTPIPFFGITGTPKDVAIDHAQTVVDALRAAATTASINPITARDFPDSRDWTASLMAEADRESLIHAALAVWEQYLADLYGASSWR